MIFRNLEHILTRMLFSRLISCQVKGEFPGPSVENTKGTTKSREPQHQN
jgi:hypothetical protein